MVKLYLYQPFYNKFPYELLSENVWFVYLVYTSTNLGITHTHIKFSSRKRSWIDRGENALLCPCSLGQNRKDQIEKQKQEIIWVVNDVKFKPRFSAEWPTLSICNKVQPQNVGTAQSWPRMHKVLTLTFPWSVFIYTPNTMIGRNH